MQSEIYFKGPTNILSNLYIIPGGLVAYENEFNTSEQLYQWRKAVENRETEIVRLILANKNPYTQLRLGKGIKTDSRWEKIKVNVMRDVLWIKLIQCVEYRQTLIESGFKPIIEDTVHEFWGRGKNNTGKNMLGCLHIELRSRIEL